MIVDNALHQTCVVVTLDMWVRNQVAKTVSVLKKTSPKKLFENKAKKNIYSQISYGRFFLSVKK